ncbi:hypothetical protein K7X08_026885 [Anisodus acutangulus]|uniref:Retrotransposon Copia-like N-terminal domain-containing protein n=1 Tax=Anisodus acutangulus TaxID=402998 RepID=A0A9Q1L9R7_9SOLA|nr:hypothetical protein K7X08_026885 [Anisodus acutangulus]
METDEFTGNKTIESISMDSSHLYYLHSSDYPGMSLVNSIFNGKGYEGWRRSVLIALSVKNKTGFINGSCVSPVTDSQNFKAPSMKRSQVLGESQDDT